MNNNKEIFQCPYCNQMYSINLPTKIKVQAIWTDGRIKTDSEPQNLIIYKCKKCKKFFKITNYIPNKDLDLSNENILSVEELSIKDYIKSLDKLSFGNMTDEIKIIIKIWHLYNDAIYRHSIKKLSLRDEMDAEYLIRVKLITLLNESNYEEAFLKAELFREFGQFNEAENILNSLNQSPFRNFILQLVKEKNHNVIKVQENKYYDYLKNFR